MFSKESERDGLGHCGHGKTRVLEIYASVYIFTGHEGGTFCIYLQPVAATWKILSLLSDIHKQIIESKLFSEITCKKQLFMLYNINNC